MLLLCSRYLELYSSGIFVFCYKFGFFGVLYARELGGSCLCRCSTKEHLQASNASASFKKFTILIFFGCLWDLAYKRGGQLTSL